MDGVGDETIRVTINAKFVTDTNSLGGPEKTGGWVRVASEAHPERRTVFAIPMNKQLIDRIERRERAGEALAVRGDFFDLPADQQANTLIWELLD